MNRREKILLYAVVGVLVFGIGMKVIRSQVLDRLSNMDKEITAKQKKLKDLEGERFRANIESKRWAQFSVETLSLDVGTAYTKMIDELDALSRKHAIANWTVRPTKANPTKMGLTPLVFNIQGEGTLPQIVPFLYDLQNLPFITQARNMKFSPLSNRQNAKSGPMREQRLQFSLKGETIVLPPDKLATSMPTAVLDSGKRKEVLRTALATVKEYLAIAEKIRFNAYVPPPPQPLTAKAPSDVSGKVNTPIQLTGSALNGKAPYQFAWAQTNGSKLTFTPSAANTAGLSVTGDTPGAATLELKVTDSEGQTAKATVRVNITSAEQVVVNKEETPPAQDPARSSTKITALLSTPDTQEVVLTGNDKRRRVIRVGEDFDGGKLVYVHPEGAVAVYKHAGKVDKNFYPLGKLMSEMKPLTEDDQPEVFFIVSLMEKGDAGGLASEKRKGS